MGRLNEIRLEISWLIGRHRRLVTDRVIGLDIKQ